ncbi:DNA-directed RNA polymerase subunit [Zea mays]|uniref:DNA-directed RNA polymerase subunit n=1 Tax=Zea mays TaxID=4577 RepID=A0A1D6EF89_MAIZE|nr:DNA-directed RNA polymerase subunit [Zea mays]
MSQLRASGGL